MEWLLVAMIGIPFLGTVLLKWIKSEKGPALLSGIVTTLVLLASLVALVQASRGQPLTSNTFNLEAGMLSATFSIISAFIWWAVSFYLYEYMQHEARPLLFYCCYLITLGAVQGLFLATNFIILLAFFEIMTVASYFWVIHRQDPEAMRSGYFYLFLGISAGLFVAAGAALLSANGVSLSIGTAISTFTNPTAISWAMILLLAGFGIKAGMFPLHIWLPMAHPVAPTPGSALLSGILIKCGVYGLIRTAQLVNFGTNLVPSLDWVGAVVVVLGVITMLLGVSLALLQSNAKRLLAYHSVSQVGYIILGIGIAIYLQGEDVLGLAGAVYHSVNHALFKSALFLGIGIIFLRTGELDLYKMGGLWRKFPITAILMLIAVFGITGTPGLNGYASKTILHHAVSEAALSGTMLTVWAERLFLVVGVGTAASFAKLFYLAFLGKSNPEMKVTKGESKSLVAAMAIISVVMLVFGLAPNLFVNHVTEPLLVSLGFGELDSLTNLNFWAASDLQGMVITLTLGILVCMIGIKTGLFHYHLPPALSLEYLGKKLVLGIDRTMLSINEATISFGSAVKQRSGKLYSKLLSFSGQMDFNSKQKDSTASFSNLNFGATVIMAVLSIMFLFYLI